MNCIFYHLEMRSDIDLLCFSIKASVHSAEVDSPRPIYPQVTHTH